MEALIAGATSFLVFHFTSHPKSAIHKKLPKKNISKRIQLTPSITLEAKNKVFHLHHWMLFTPLYFVTQQTGSGIWNSSLVHGFLLGGIIQGLLYADRFRIVFNANEYRRTRRSTYNVSFLRKLI